MLKILRIKKITFILRFFFLKREPRLLEASFNETSFLRSHPFLQWKFLFFPLLSPLFYESHSCSLEFLSSRTCSPLLLVHLSKKIIFLYSSIRFTFYPRNRTLYSLSSLSFFLRRNISLHTTWFRIISLLKFYFFLLFFFFLLLSEYITFSSASKTFFNLLFFNEILRSNFIYAIFTPFFPLKEDSCLSLYVKRIENTPSFRIFLLFHKIRTASNIPFSFFFFLLPLK